MSAYRKVDVPRMVRTSLLAACVGLTFHGEGLAASCKESKVVGVWAFNVAAETNAAGEDDASARIAKLKLKRDNTALFEQRKYIESEPDVVGGDRFEATWYLDRDCFGVVEFPMIGSVNIDFIILYAAKSDKLHIGFSNPLETVRADRLR